MQMPFFHCRHSGCVRMRWLWAVCLFVLSISQAIRADEISNLFEARIPVESQDRELRNEAIRTAFKEVLVRVSGRSDIAEATAAPGIQEAIERATRYAQQFRYLQAEAAAPGQTGLILWVRFDEAAVSRLLRDNQLPVWGSTRPATLVWLAVDNRGQRELVGNDKRDEFYQTLVQRAQSRGVPLRFPLLDLTDRANLRVSDVWGNFETTILRASQRYQTEAVLVGRVFQGYSGYWTARWSLYADGRRQDWSVSGQSIAEVLSPGIDKTAESLAIRYAQVAHVDDGEVLVQVRGIRNLSDYNRVVDYLRSLSHVSAVQTSRLEAESAIFQINVPGGRLSVARAVALGHTLATVPVESVTVTPQQDTQTATAPVTTVVPDLIYRLVP